MQNTPVRTPDKKTRMRNDLVTFDDVMLDWAVAEFQKGWIEVFWLLVRTPAESGS